MIEREIRMAEPICRRDHCRAIIRLEPVVVGGREVSHRIIGVFCDCDPPERRNDHERREEQEH